MFLSEKKGYLVTGKPHDAKDEGEQTCENQCVRHQIASTSTPIISATFARGISHRSPALIAGTSPRRHIRYARVRDTPRTVASCSQLIMCGDLGSSDGTRRVMTPATPQDNN